MIHSNGTGQQTVRSDSAYRRAVQRHRAELAAWRQIQKCRIALRAAYEEYNAAVKWAGMPGLPLPGSSVDPPPVNGLVGLPEPDFESLTPKEREAIIRPELEAIDRRVSEEEAAELPDGGEPPKPKRERKPKPEPPPAPPAEPQTDGQPPWTSEDLDQELLHALVCAEWRIDEGMTNPEILEVLSKHWRGQECVDISAKQSGGRFGYTFFFSGGIPYFWIGEYFAGRKATVHGQALIDRIRRLLEIPTPTQAQKLAQSTFREAAISQGIPMNAPSVQQKRPGGPRFVSRPAGGWEDADLHNAADDLRVPFGDLAACDKCGAARDHVVHPCPNCGSPNFVHTDSPAVWGAPAYQSKTAAMPAAEPVRRGPGRPKGSKTRKAVAP